MMATDSLKDALQPVLAALKQLGGRFVFTDDEGKEYIIAAADEVTRPKTTERQLPLPQGEYKPHSFVVRGTADELQEKINREIALFHLQQVDEEVVVPTPEPLPPLRIRFEPLRGDLPPELQE